MTLIQIHPSDDMAVAPVDLEAGTRVRAGNGDFVLLSAVPAKHKVYVRDLPQGAVARLYGVPVGRTRRAVTQGELVGPNNLESLRGAGEAPASDPPSWEPPSLAGLPTTFQGFVRPDGKVGTRNHLLVTYTVPCVKSAAERVAFAVRRAFGFETEDPWVRYARDGRLDGGHGTGAYDGVDDVVVLHHEGGCGMADRGEPEALLRFLAGYILHPNVAGAVVLGLGCEKTPVSRLQALVGQTWKPVVYLEHQRAGAEDDLIRAGIDALRTMLPEAARHRRQEVAASALVLGTKCGGSDGFSGITVNPALGWVSGAMVAQGGGVLLPEVPEMFGGEQLLAARAIDDRVARRVLELVRGYADYAAKTGTHPAENPSPGNVREGLITIEMKSLGAIQKAGRAPVVGVLDYAETIPGPGLYLLNTPGYDVISTSALPASGAAVIVFTTGLGTPLGNPVVPVIKAASNHRTATRMADIIDFDAGSALDGEPIPEIGRRLYRLVMEVASGRKTANERLGHRESAFWQRQVAL